MSSAQVLNVNPSLLSVPYWFRLGFMYFVRIGNHIYDKDGSYMGVYNEKAQEIDTTGEGGEDMEDTAREWAKTHKPPKK